MDGNNPKPTQGLSNMATNSWRTHQQIPGVRQKILSHIINVLKQHSPSDDHAKIMDVALSYEERTFTAAASKEDYMKKVARKLNSIKPGVERGSFHSLQTVPPGATENPGDQENHPYGLPRSNRISSHTILSHQGQQSLQLPAQSVVKQRQQSQEFSFVQTGKPTLFPENRTNLHHLSRQNKIPMSLGTQSGMGSFQSTIMKQQPVVPLQQQSVKTVPASSSAHGRLSQPDSNKNSFVFQAQSSPANLEHPHPTKVEIGQAVPMSNSLFQAQQLRLQRKQFLDQNTFPAQSANLKLERGEVDVDTWREEIYQWLQTMKKFFLPELRHLCYKLDANLRQIPSAPQPQMTAEKEKQYEVMLHRVKKTIMALEIARHKIEPQYKQHFAKVENDIINFFKSQEEKRSMSSQHHKQLSLPNMNAFQQPSPHPHIQNPLPADTNMLQSLQSKQQVMPSSHLGEQKYPQGNVKQQLAPQKRQREIENMQQPLDIQAHQKSVSHMNLTEVMNAKKEMGNRRTHMKHHLQTSLEKQKGLQTFPEKTESSTGVQQASREGPPAAISVQKTTSGLSATALLKSSSNKDNNSQESSVIEHPIQRLLRAVKSMSPATLSASVETMITTYNPPEIFPPSPSLIRGGNSDSSISEMESVTTFPERTTIKAGEELKGNDLLMEEIRTINQQLMSTYVEICDKNDNSITATFTKDGQAKIVKCTFIDLATRHYSTSSKHASENLSPIQPLKLLITGNYPGQSPLVLDELSTIAKDGDGTSSLKNEDLTGKAISKLKLYLRRFEKPLSLEKIAKAWDACAHGVFRGFAEQHGGGSLSSRYGAWENCASTS